MVSDLKVYVVSELIRLLDSHQPVDLVPSLLARMLL